MERQRENREELFWDHQMLKAGRINTAIRNTQSSTNNYSAKIQEQNSEQFIILCLQSRTKRLSTRLVLDGVWSVLPSLSQRVVVTFRQGDMCHGGTDILQLLHYKYDIIKERLYREMLQDEYDSFNGFGRSFGSVDFPGCPKSFKRRDHSWSSKPREQAWSAVIFLSDLESSYQEEKESLTALINRVGQEALRVMYLSMCVAVRRVERENQSYTALLVARQHWDRWPYMRGSVSQDLARIWLQENQDHITKKHQNRKTSNCTQQAVLQYLVLCQEQERKQLVEILHRISLTDLQGLKSMPDSNDMVQGNTEDVSCVLRLQQIKAALQDSLTAGCSGTEVSWGECAVHLLTQLTLAQEDEAWSILYSLPDLDPEGLWTVLHKYESELHRPNFHNLHEAVHSHVPAQSTRGQSRVNTDTEKERIEQECEASSDSEKQDLCTGCGMALDAEDTPYLEILCIRDPRDEQVRDGERERHIESRGNDEEISVEKQNSLITLAWSKPAHGEDQIQKVTSALQEVDAAATAVQEEKPAIYMHQKQISTVSLQPSAQYEETQPEHHVNVTQETRTETEQVHSALITAGQQHEDVRDGQTPSDIQQPTSQQQTGNTNTTDQAIARTHTFEAHEMEASRQKQRSEEETCTTDGEEQQLQREATMRCLVDIQKRAERRWQRDRDRQLLRVQERLAIVQSRKSDEDLLGLTQEDTIRHLTDTLRQEDEQQQKTLVREKLQQMRRERSYILQNRRERNTAGFKELLAPTAQRMTETEEGH
ncbi:uncharacterized protein LOC127623075 [Xyrauchen texanus]|uniref:uncharacterized protein LOC127623075 n=1 Tax=Xyrauchen texanus TaxID=154827 RepID=UPI0022420502|nr:uncharacterized protein LOC127623075 [Xyrauchen texanus]